MAAPESIRPTSFTVTTYGPHLARRARCVNLASRDVAIFRSGQRMILTADAWVDHVEALIEECNRLGALVWNAEHRRSEMTAAMREEDDNTPSMHDGPMGWVRNRWQRMEDHGVGVSSEELRVEIQRVRPSQWYGPAAWVRSLGRRVRAAVFGPREC